MLVFQKVTNDGDTTERQPLFHNQNTFLLHDTTPVCRSLIMAAANAGVTPRHTPTGTTTHDRLQ